MPPSTHGFPCRNCGGGDKGGVAIYRPFGEFRRAKSYCHLYGAQGQRQLKSVIVWVKRMSIVTPFQAMEKVTSERCVNISNLMIYLVLLLRTLQVSTKTSIKHSVSLSSFRALGAEDVWVPFTLVDQNLLPETLVKSSLSGPLGARPKCPKDKTTLIKRTEYKIRK
ncbi:hypothetical protein TNCV_386981 [Trichonephila clavipes]|nr:hypothetical protein TNCV_386981 [Trichonephila clavipes]